MPGLEIVGLADLPITIEVEETGATFRDNALIKAKAYSELTGELALADDSGLEVDALDGAPGVMSARYGGPGLSDEQRVQKLLGELKKVPGWKRTARFRAALALYGPGVPAEGIVTEGLLEGAITHQPIGSNGFGYDPVFWIASEAATTAMLSGARKDRLSHRGRAARAMLEHLTRIARSADSRR